MELTSLFGAKDEERIDSKNMPLECNAKVHFHGVTNSRFTLLDFSIFALASLPY